jgi:signal peptidase I
MTAPIATNSSVPNTNASAAKPKADAGHEGHRDTSREIFETIVFVVVLVLLLKLFVAEAFVIPTGSMAPTLWGDQVRCTCRKCGHKFPINVAAGQNGKHLNINAYICENCGYHCNEKDDAKNDFSSASSGDRVLVSKYEYHLRNPHRFEIPVFRYPVEPFVVTAQNSSLDLQGMNYIKRLVGLGGETLAVFAGDLYTTTDLDYKHIPRDQQPQNELEAWQFRYMYAKDDVAKKYFKAGKFKIVRKTPDQVLAVRRIVFDLDHQPDGPIGIRKTRWHPSSQEGSGWEMEDKGFKHTGDVPGTMIYQHLDPWHETPPQLINDAIGYNCGVGERMGDPFPGIRPDPKFFANHWVSDLIVECTVEINSADAEFVMDLSKGQNRLLATFSKGECRLSRMNSGSAVETRTEMGKIATKMTKPGKYALRFANVDSRLTVWVDNKPLRFSDDQCDYSPPDPTKNFESFDKNDMEQPARITATGDVTCSKVSLWRDLHYNCSFPSEHDLGRIPFEPDKEDIPDCQYNGLYLQTYYVQPGHYLMMGDNTNSSKDSRSWGVVPDRLMLGRAVVIYWPGLPNWRLRVIE